MKQKNILITIFAGILVVSCGKKETLHSPFPETIQSQKTKDHVRIINTNIHIKPPNGFAKVVNEDGVTYTKGQTEHEFITVSRNKNDRQLSIEPGKVKKELVSEIISVQPVTYNGNKGIFFETRNYNIHDAELRVEMPDGSMLRLMAQYRHDSDPSTVEQLLETMQNVIWEQRDATTSHEDQLNRLTLKTGTSRFKLASTSAGTVGTLQYYYTLQGKTYDAVPPYLWVFESSIYFENVTGNVKADNSDFPSFGEHLNAQGFQVLPKKMPYAINLPNHRVSYFEGKDLTIGLPVSLMLYEVKHDQSVIVMIGVVKKNDEATLAELKQLASTITINE